MPDSKREQTTGNSVDDDFTSETPDTSPNVYRDEQQGEIASETEIETPMPTGDAATEREEEYPAAWRLGLITIALCLSVFCMALVRIVALLRLCGDFNKLTSHFSLPG